MTVPGDDRLGVELTLRDSQALLFSAIHESPLLMTIIDLSTGRYLEVNHTFCKVSELSQAEVIGKTPVELGWQKTEGWARLQQALRTDGKVVGLELELSSKSGKPVICRYWGDVVRTADGDRLFLAAEDITERRLLEIELQETHIRLAQSMDQARLAYWELDTATSTFTFNDRFYALYGTTAAREGGYTMSAEKYAREFLPPEEQYLVADAIRQLARKNGDDIQIEHRIRRRDGELRNIVVHITVTRDATGQIVGSRGSNQDISERKHAEAERQASEERYRLLFDQAGDYILVLEILPDAPPIIQDANQAALLAFGYSRDELIGKPTSFLEPKDPHPHITETRRQRVLASDGRTAVFEVRHRRKDGSLFDAEVRAREVLLNGKLLCVSVEHDITERKRAEAALRESQRMLNTVLDTIPARVFWKDREGRFLGANTRFALDAGFASPDEIVGKDDTQMPWSAEADRYRADDCQVMDSKISKLGYEEPQTTCDGNTILLRTSKVPLCGEDGGVLGVLGTYEDITERKRVEAALSENERRYALLANNIPDIAYSLDGTGNIVTVNEAAFERYGYDEQSIKGKPFLEFIHPEDRTVLLGSFLSGIEQKRAVTAGLQFRILSRAGTTHWFELNSRARFDEQGGYLGEDGVLRDITDRKQAESERAKLEEQLHQAQKMESVGRLAGGVAHDFNNMLSVILGNADLALQQVEPSHPLRADLDEIRAAATRSAALTRQLLAFARKQIVAPVDLELNEVVTNMLKMLRRLIGEDIQLRWNPQTDLWHLKVDPSQIDQILANLCVNARDAIAGVGNLTLETANVSFDAEHCASHAGFLPGEFVKLRVRDDGCGMDKETLAHLFEPFFTTKSTGEGTGLGLSTVYGIVSQNNGFIDVQSEPGTGTTFDIYLPRYKTATGQPRTVVEANPSGMGHETILLVEDEAAILRLTTRMLERRGYVVLAAGTPKEALRLAETHVGEIQLLMTDVIMPEMDGHELAEILVARFPRLKRLFMSGYTAEAIGRHGVLEEGVAFLPKPFSSTDLTSKVREVLDSE